VLALSGGIGAGLGYLVNDVPQPAGIPSDRRSRGAEGLKLAG